MHTTVQLSNQYPPAIYAADKVSKVRELRSLMVAGADREVVESKRRHYRRCLTMLEEPIPESRITELPPPAKRPSGCVEPPSFDSEPDFVGYTRRFERLPIR